MKFQSPSDATSREWYARGLYGGLCFFEVALVCVKDVSNLVISLCFIPAKDFIQCLLQIDPKRRYTCKQALAHPWYVELVVSCFVLIISVSYCPKVFQTLFSKLLGWLGESPMGGFRRFQASPVLPIVLSTFEHMESQKFPFICFYLR